MLEEDGSDIVSSVLEAIIDGNEKVGVIMVLKADEAWSPGDMFSFSDFVLWLFITVL